MSLRARTSIIATGVLGAVLLATGCKDAREASLGPAIVGLGGGDIFGITSVTMAISRHHNVMAARALELIETGTTLPVAQPDCRGTGTVTIGLQGGDPNHRRFEFSNYWIDCGEPIDLLANGEMLIEFHETDPGLSYTITLPFAIDGVTIVPLGVAYTLPAEAGGLDLEVTGVLECELHEAALRHEGGVHQTGTLRFEDRTALITAVQEIDVEYEFDDALQPPFANWPSGRVELAVFQVSAFSGGVPSIPVHITLDGFGGASFELDNVQCDTNLATGENPCEDL